MLRGRGIPLVENEKASKFQSFLVSGFQSFKVSKIQSFRVPLFQSFKDSKIRHIQNDSMCFSGDLYPVSPTIHFVFCNGHWSHIQISQNVLDGPRRFCVF